MGLEYCEKCQSGGGSVSAAWFKGRALSFDTETTGVDTETCRIVTGHAVEVGADGAKTIGSWLVNPGVPIPAEASAIHGITDEIAATGWKPLEAVGQMRDRLEAAWADGLPVIICNAPFDLGLLFAECDRYRRGKRTLTALAEHYGVKQGAAHSAEGDALTAARVVWAQAKVYTQTHAIDLAGMQKLQADAHFSWAVNYADHLRGKHPGVEPKVSTAWPIGRSNAHTRAA